MCIRDRFITFRNHFGSVLKSIFFYDAMHRFRSPLASSSSGRPEQPASASRTPSQLKIVSIRDGQLWLADESIANCSSADVQRIREAAAVLSRPKPRQEDVEPLQSKWQERQQTKGKKRRRLGEVLKEFQDKVINAAQKLQQQLSDSAEPVSYTHLTLPTKRIV